MHIEQGINELSCTIAQAIYDKYQSEAYGLTLCPSCYNKEDIENKKLLLDLLTYYKDKDSGHCNIEYIKSLI